MKTMAGNQAASHKEEIVISGISCRLPESDNMQEFRDNLMNGVDMVTEDDRRWKPGVMGLPKRNGKLKDLSKFDATFFGVHPKQATYMDPQLRILMELAYEAIIDAGVNPETIRGSNTGVFVGAQSSESQSVWCSSGVDAHLGYILTGSAMSMFSNRLSFALDLKGPSFTVDTACSSGLFAMNQALNSVRSGECEAAIVAGSNILLRPEVSAQFHSLGMLSPEGKCRSFDKDGVGYCRSEGISLMYLQKKKDAKRVYCTLVHSKVNSDGNKEQGITFPSGPTQKRLLEEAYYEAGIDPRDVAYVEAHGTGTPAGDPQECYAINEIFCKDRKDPLLIGSVKSNMGHCECASGTASFAKLIIAMEEHVIPANLHFNEPSEYLPSIKAGKLEVVAKNTPWSGGLIGVNSFGFGGANAHVIVKSNPKEKISYKGCDKSRLFVYGGRTQEAAEDMLKMAQKHASDIDLHALLNETANMSVDTHPYRGFTILNSKENSTDIQKVNEEKGPVWFVFSGMGSQWSGMGKTMMEIEVFRNSILKSDAILKQYGVNLYDILMTEDEELMKSVVNSFVCITSVQVALVDMLNCLGIKPDGIIGHSVGELGCAYADGSLTAEEAVLAAYWRGHCVQNAKLPPGQMAAVGMTWEQALQECPPGVVPACHNAEESVTVSGPVAEVKSFVEALKEKGTFAREVQSAGVAFHSYFMKNVASALKSALDKVIVAKPRSEKWISSSYPESAWSTDEAKMSSADYHVHNLVSPVLFHEAVGHVPSNAVVIEIAPHCLLQSILKGSLGSKCCIVGLMKRKNPDNQAFCLTSLGKCYQHGVKLDPLKLFPPVDFPVSRGTPIISNVVKWDHSDTWEVPKVESGSNLGTSFEIDLSKNSEYRYFLDHQIDGRPVLPAAGYLVLAWKALANREERQWDQMPVMFEDVIIHRATLLVPDAKQHIDVKFIPGSENFQVLQRDDVIVSGKICVPESKILNTFFNKNPDRANTENTIPTLFKPADLYKDFRIKGFEYGPAFQLLLGAHDENKAVIKWNNDWIAFIDTMTQFPILKIADMFLPTRMTTVVIDPELHQAHVRNFEDDIKGIDLQVSKETDIRKAGGVHIHGITVTHARRTEQTPPLLETVHFVPFMSSLDPSEQDQDILKYANRCQVLSRIEFEKTVNNGISKSLIPSDKFITSNQIKTTNVGQDTQESFSDNKANSYLAVLESMSKLTHNGKYSESVTEILKTEQEKFQFDILLGNLLQEKNVRPCLDIWVEYMKSKTVKVVEICSTSVSEKIHELITSSPLVKSSYCVATKDPTAFETGSKTSKITEVINWEPGKELPDTLQNVRLIVASNIIRKHKNLRMSLRAITDMLDEEGFAVVHEVTSNFHIAAPADGVYCNTFPEFDDLNERTCSIYCDLPKWKQLFSDEGLEVVYEVSDTILSSLFLLRKNLRNTVDKQTMIDVTDTSCGWVDEVKSKMEEVASKPKGENLWLRADSNISGILGLVNCLRMEEGGEKIRCILNMDGPQASPDIQTMEMLVRHDLITNVYKNGKWGCYVHLPLDFTKRIPSAHAYVNVLKRGDLSSLTWVQSRSGRSQLSKEFETEQCDVTYASLNFRDVMLATGKLPPDAIPGDLMDKVDCLLGMEFSGRNSEGKRVMGLVPFKGLATSVDTLKQLLWTVPDHWTLEQAATVPTVYTTAFYALVVRGNMKTNNTVLIHSGSGGVGQAAISIALHYGCKVFTTVGTPEKRQCLKEKFPELDDSCFFSSRDTAFELGILEATDGKGVDIVLNSLSEDKLQASVRVLANHGKFLEIGKYDLAKNTPLGMSVFLKNITFHGILMDSLFDAKNSDLEVVSRCMMEGIKSGMVQPLQSTVFDKDSIEGAFRYMAGGKHIGKVLIKVREDCEPVLVPALPRATFDPDKTYIITGGLGGFGLELAHWMVKRGARNLVLTSRSGVKTGYQKYKLLYLQRSGINVTVSTRNICNKEEAYQLFQDVNGKAVGGVFHLAMVLEDAIFENQTQESFQKVLEPKLIGTLNLDQITRERCKNSLEWFVLFSSTSSGYGNAGQTNYAMANSCMERIVEQRKKDGYPGTAIQWGPIGDVGVFIDSGGKNDTQLGGSVPQRLTSCFQSLDPLLNQSEPIVTSFVRAEVNSGSKQSGGNLLETICNILGIKNMETLDENRSFGDLGLDSLLAVEVKLTLESEYNIVLNSKDIRELTLKKLKSLAQGGDVTADSQEAEPELDVSMFFDTDPNARLLPVTVVQKLNDIEEGIPLFIIHDVWGSIVTFKHVVSQLKVPVYGLERTVDVPLDSIAELADFYAKAIQDTCKGQPFHLAGYSFGSCIAEEMALLFQSRQSDDFMSLILLDGSHTWVPTVVDSLGKNQDNVELKTMNMVFESIGLDLTDVYNFTIENLEKMIQMLIMIKPDTSFEDATALASGTHTCVKLACDYKPDTQYHGNLTLIKAAKSVQLPGLTEDYGLNEFCTGKVTIHSVPGRHVSFLKGSSGDQVASIISGIISAEKAN